MQREKIFFIMGHLGLKIKINHKSEEAQSI